MSSAKPFLILSLLITAASPAMAGGSASGHCLNVHHAIDRGDPAELERVLEAGKGQLNRRCVEPVGGPWVVVHGYLLVQAAQMRIDSAPEMIRLLVKNGALVNVLRRADRLATIKRLVEDRALIRKAALDDALASAISTNDRHETPYNDDVIEYLRSRGATGYRGTHD